MGDSIVVGNLDRNLVRKLLVQAEEHFFVRLVAGAKGDDNHFFAGQPVRDLRDEIEPLLRGKTRHDADYGKFRVGRGHPEGG